MKIKQYPSMRKCGYYVAFNIVVKSRSNYESVAKTGQPIQDMQSAAKNHKSSVIHCVGRRRRYSRSWASHIWKNCPEEDIGRSGNSDDATYRAKYNVDLLRNIC
ncbi:MAG: hypothetical protein IJQ82_03915, partial [Selenomonadaceae bacterium]|nr:hypothetical protein [Selenomonadaceae bacterium]